MSRLFSYYIKHSMISFSLVYLMPIAQFVSTVHILYILLTMILTLLYSWLVITHQAQGSHLKISVFLLISYVSLTLQLL